MPQVSNSTEGIRRWFRQCPLLSKNKRFGADYLGENPTEYAIYASPSTLTYHENILGDYVLDDKQTQNYIFATRENFGADVKQNSDNLAINTNLRWIRGQCGNNSAKYQIQIQITYRRN